MAALQITKAVKITMVSTMIVTTVVEAMRVFTTDLMIAMQ